MEYSNNLYNKNLKNYANSLRHRMTKAEACLWKYCLKAGMLKGYKFRRQRPVLNYIADFINLDLKLIVEVDGYTHQFEEQINKDLKREEKLKSLGYRIIRFQDNEVLSNIDGVIKELSKIIEEIENSPPPAPASGGDKTSSVVAG